jgi:hypothetical protein
MCRMDVYHWGAGLVVTGRTRDIGQKVLQSSFLTGNGSSPDYLIFFKSHSSRKLLVERQ